MGSLAPGLRSAYPGLCSSALSGRLIPSPNMSHLPAADVHSPSPFMERGWPTGRGRGQTPAASGVHSPSPFMERGWPTGRGRGHELHFLPFSWMISRTISGASPEYRTISRSFIPCESIFATIVCCIMAIPSSIPSLCPCLRPFFKPI